MKKEKKEKRMIIFGIFAGFTASLLSLIGAFINADWILVLVSAVWFAFGLKNLNAYWKLQDEERRRRR